MMLVTIPSTFSPLLRLVLAFVLLFAQTGFAQHHPGAPAVTQQKVEQGTLEPGAPAARDIKGGETHGYRLALASGQYARLRLEQSDIDLHLALLADDGTKLLESDVMLSSHGFETLLYAADTSGNYRVEVRANKKNAPPTRYEVKVEERRQASPQDRRKVAACRAILEADALFKRWTDEGQRKAIASYEAALAALEGADDPALRARALKGIGLAHEFLHEFQKAADAYQKALPYLQTTDDRHEPAFTLNEIARALAPMHQYQKAITYRARALEGFRTVARPGRVIETLNSLALLHNDIGEGQKAINYLLESLALARAEKLLALEAQALNFLGLVYQYLQDQESALYYYSSALKLVEGKNQLEEAYMLHNLARTYVAVGDHKQGLAYFDRALPMMRTFRHRDGEAHVLLGLGLVRLSMNDVGQALESFTLALSILREEKVMYSQAVVLNQIGLCHARLGDDDKAYSAHREALAYTTAAEDRPGEIMSRYYLARLHRKRGDQAEALGEAEKATRLIESLRAKVEVQDLRSSLFNGFQNCYELYIDLLMQPAPAAENVAAALGVNERFRARTLLDSLQESRANLSEGVERPLIMQKRELSRRLNQQAIQLTSLLNRKHTAEEADARRREIEATTIELQALRAKIRQASPRYAELTDPQPLSPAEIQAQVVDRDSVLLEYALGEERSYLWAITPDKVTGYTLPGRSRIDAAARRFYQLLTARNQNLRHETVDERRARLAAAEAELPQATAALSEMVLAPATAQIRGKQLLIVSDGSLQYIPFAALTLPGSHRPLIMDTGVVNLPSASALAVLRRERRGRAPAPKTLAIFGDPVFSPNDERLVLAKAARKPAPAVVSQSRNRGLQTTRPTNGTAAAPGPLPAQPAEYETRPPFRDISRAAKGAGFEEAGPALPRIPFTRKEANAIAALVPPSQRLQALDFEASKAAATGQGLGQYRYIHFATHGFLNTTHPELSGIALSMIDKDGREQDGFLRAHEIYNLRLPAELVVLSGCRTGLGRELRGEGLIGLTRGFLYAGASRVLVSLWDIHDEATAEFMGHFYQALLGRERLSPAAALRRAQATMAGGRRWSSPYYWAAFVLQGEIK